MSDLQVSATTKKKKNLQKPAQTFTYKTKHISIVPDSETRGHGHTT